MPKVFVIAASVLKSVMVVTTSALARGDRLPIILISVIFDLALQTRRKAVHTHTTQENNMRSLVSAGLIVTCVVASCSIIARADPLRVAVNPLPAPIGHAQPRAGDFSPGSQAEQAVQDRLSAFDAEQKRLDELLNKKLAICRC
jgi:hypothetical protein